MTTPKVCAIISIVNLGRIFILELCKEDTMIIKQFTSSKVGNDCLIKDSVMLVKNGDAYIVIHTTSYVGSWTPDEPDSQFYCYGSESDAMSTFDMVVKKVI